MSGIVFFSPHPDDVEFVLGGTVLLHCNRYATKIVVQKPVQVPGNAD